MEKEKDIIEDDLEDNSLDTIVLEDEFGVETEFEIVSAFDLANDSYVALVPLDEFEGDDEQSEEDDFDFDFGIDLDEASDLVILKQVQEGGEDLLAIIEDMDEYERVLEEFLKHIPKDFEFQE